MKKRVRRSLSGLLSVILMLGVLLAAPVQAAGIAYGDVDGKEGITANDALSVLQHQVELIVLSSEQLVIADVNADGKVDATDALMILQYIVELIDSFPAEEAEGLTMNPWSPDTLAYQQSTEAFDAGDVRTTFQQSGGYKENLDVQSDSTMVYVSTIAEVEGQIYEGWKKAQNSAAVSLDIMIPGGRDNGHEYYQYYPERGTYDAQKYADGSIRYHTAPVAYMMPTRSYAEYKWTLVDKICELLEPSFITIEEPECWLESGYNEGFKEEWQRYYGEEWQDPTISAEARYKASKLMAQLWVDMITMIGKNMKEKYPDVGLVIATHSGPNYIRHGIAAAINSYTNIPYVTGIIAQVWSDTIAVPVNYAGEYQERAFEAGFLGYASFPDSMQEGQTLFSLTDAKADNASFGWDKCYYLWQKSITSQLMQSGINNYQECVWPSRGFTPAPADYKTSQLNMFNLMRDIGGKETNLYAGTPGISIALGDTFTWMKNHSDWMSAGTSQNGLYGMAIPLIERGIPITVTSLDHIQSAADLEGVKVLMLSYDTMKPLSEQVNIAIADWVKQGGTVLYLGGHDEFDNVTVEWWNQKDQTPLENLVDHLGLNMEISPADEEGVISWCGDSKYGESITDIFAINKTFDYADIYTGDGFTPIMKLNETDAIGVDAKVGSGHFIAVGMPSSYFADNAEGPQQMRDLVKYAVQYTDVQYYETTLMTMQRGEYLIAEALLSSEGETLTGDFIDLFDHNLSLIKQKTLGSNESAVLLDLTKFRTEGTPRIAFTGGVLKNEAVETADTTTFTISGPADTDSATRILGNGRYPASITATLNGEIFGNYAAMWDNDTASLLIKTSHMPTENITFTITWSDTKVDTTVPYRRASVTVKTNEKNDDQEFISKDTSQATRSLKRVEYDGELTYCFDLNKYPDIFVAFDVFYNYRIEVSTDGTNYTKVVDYLDDHEELVSNMSNRAEITIYASQYAPDSDKLYVRLSNAAPEQQYGTGISSFTMNYRKPLSSDSETE